MFGRRDSERKGKGIVFWGRERGGNSGDEKGREARVIRYVSGQGFKRERWRLCDRDSDGNVKFGQRHVSLWEEVRG